jgi:hypothetical protein
MSSGARKRRGKLKGVGEIKNVSSDMGTGAAFSCIINTHESGRGWRTHFGMKPMSMWEVNVKMYIK